MNPVKQRLVLPGPTPIPPRVQRAMQEPMIGHRSQQFVPLFHRCRERLQKVFQTHNEVLILTSSGSGGLEAAITNAVAPGEKVLALSAGKFGERLFEIAQAWGADVDILSFVWGTAIDLIKVEEQLKATKYTAVLATHNETSTAVTHDIQGLSKLVRKYGGEDTLLIVDAVSSMGGVNIPTDDWDVDIMVTGSQKAFMLPPGLAFVSVSERAWRKIEQNPHLPYYFSLPAARKSAQKGNTPWTPAVSLILGLDAALDLLFEEGLENVWRRHRLLAEATREAVVAMGLSLFARSNYSDTVTAIEVPDGCQASELLGLLRQRYGVILSGGQAHLKGRIFRIAHMGFMDGLDTIQVIAALEMALSELGLPVQLGQGVAAAQKVLCR